MRILLIEDDAVLGMAVRDHMAADGHSVDWVRLLEDADAAIRAAVYDLVLLDLMLPDTDGYRVLRTLRDEGNVTPVVILTALGEEADKVRGFRFGADDYVTKPFGLMELLARIDALLRRASRAPAPQPAPSCFAGSGWFASTWRPPSGSLPPVHVATPLSTCGLPRRWS